MCLQACCKLLRGVHERALNGKYEINKRVYLVAVPVNYVPQLHERMDVSAQHGA